MKSGFIASIILCIPFILNGQDCKWNYRFNPDSDDGHSFSCGEITDNGVTVSQNTCNFYTPLTTLADAESEADSWVHINAEFDGSDNLDETDFIWIFYYVNGQTAHSASISGSLGKTAYYFNDSIQVPSSSTFKVRVAFVCDDSDEFWSLQKNNFSICVSNQKSSKSATGIIPENPISISKERGCVRLRWMANPGYTPNYFKIERSSDGKNYSFAGFVKENYTAAGNTIYSFIDSRPSQPRSWYRVKQVDANGYENLIGNPVYINP